MKNVRRLFFQGTIPGRAHQPPPRKIVYPLHPNPNAPANGWPTRKVTSMPAPETNLVFGLPCRKSPTGPPQELDETPNGEAVARHVQVMKVTLLSPKKIDSLTYGVELDQVALQV